MKLIKRSSSTVIDVILSTLQVEWNETCNEQGDFEIERQLTFLLPALSTNGLFLCKALSYVNLKEDVILNLHMFFWIMIKYSYTHVIICMSMAYDICVLSCSWMVAFAGFWLLDD